MNPTKIEWTDYTWNPIKGLCPVGCWYCYGRKIYKRFKWIPQLRFDQRALEKPCYLKKPSKIFVCSTFELFHPNVKSWYRDKIFEIIHYHPQHTFQILTKFPQNIDRDMPDNVWLGVSITKPSEMYPRVKSLYQAQAKLKFISFEPLLGDVGQFHFQGYLGGKVDWIIIGRLTGHGHKYDPKDYWITSLVYHAKKFNTPIFLKDNLRDVWKNKLIQEFPLEEGR